MLTYLHIKDFAIIDEVEIEWGEGFDVLTGETGAGKSIILNAVSLIRGEKANQSLIRAGREKAIIEAIFKIDREEVKEHLNHAEIEYEEEIIIRRIISTGRSKVFVNDTPVTLNFLSTIAPYLIGIDGQHSQQLLLQPKFYLEILDEYAEIKERVKKFEEKFRQLKALEVKLEELRQQEKERNKKLEFLNYQLEEIEKINPIIGEDEELEKEKKILSESEKILLTMSDILDAIYIGEDTIIERLKAIVKESEKLNDLGEKWEEFYSHISEALYNLEDAAYIGEDLTSMVKSDPVRLEEVTERLLELGDLKRKYGPTLKDVLKEKENIKEEITLLENINSTLEDKEKKLQKMQEEIEKEAEEISSIRKKTARSLQKKVEEELSDLAMERAKFIIEIVPATLFSKGKDKVEIKIAPNLGEPPKPLQKIASGGELSRIMLALRSSLGKKSPPSTIIFDEVDSGIGGKTAETVGNKLRELSTRSQLIVITHLPQIAFRAGRHYKVEKKILGERTVSTINEVKGEERVHELARMLGKIDRETINYVKKMIGNM